MKNRYDYLKGKFGAWNKLKSKTGNVYNPVTNTFNLSEEEWQIEMKSNKYVEGLRSSPLPYPDLCVQLFEGSTSNGFDSWGPSSTIPRSSASATFEDLPDHNLDGVEHIECTQMEPPTQNKEETLKDKENKGAKRKDRETLNSKLIEVGAQITKVANMLIEKHNLSNDMEACMEKLETLGWGRFDAKYQTAQLRNVIERAYGVLKARFPILKQMAPFSFQVQRDVVIACFAVHNFIRKYNINDPLFVDYDENTTFSEIQGGGSDGQFVHDMEWGSQGIEYMTTLRNQIATQIISSD